MKGNSVLIYCLMIVLCTAFSSCISRQEASEFLYQTAKNNAKSEEGQIVLKGLDYLIKHIDTTIKCYMGCISDPTHIPLDLLIFNEDTTKVIGYVFLLESCSSTYTTGWMYSAKKRDGCWNYRYKKATSHSLLFSDTPNCSDKISIHKSYYETLYSEIEISEFIRPGAFCCEIYYERVNEFPHLASWRYDSLHQPEIRYPLKCNDIYIADSLLQADSIYLANLLKND